MGAFALFSLLPAQRMYDLRWKLITFVVAVLALEVVTVVAVQMAMTKSADMSQQAGAQRAQDLRRQITQAETEATALRAQAGQLANSEHSWVKAGVPKVAAMAASAAAKTDGLYAELAKVDSTQHPTLIGLFGEDWAMAYAIARGVLVSCAGLVFWGAVGALWRAFMAGAQPRYVGPEAVAPQYVPPQALPVPAPPPAPAPVVASEPQGAPASEGSGANFVPNWKGWAAGAALPLALGAASVPGTAQAATVPAVQPVGEGVLKPVHLTGTPDTQTDAHPTEVRPKRRSTAAGVKIDTGVGLKDGFRYRRVRAAVKAGRLRPSVRAIKLAEGGSDETVRGYLAQLEREGLIERSGRGWRLAPCASSHRAFNGQVERSRD